MLCPTQKTVSKAIILIGIVMATFTFIFLIVWECSSGSIFIINYPISLVWGCALTSCLLIISGIILRHKECYSKLCCCCNTTQSMYFDDEIIVRENDEDDILTYKSITESNTSKPKSETFQHII